MAANSQPFRSQFSAVSYVPGRRFVPVEIVRMLSCTRFVPFRAVFFVPSFFAVSFRFASLRFASFCFVSLRFASLRFVLFRFAPFRFASLRFSLRFGSFGAIWCRYSSRQAGCVVSLGLPRDREEETAGPLAARFIHANKKDNNIVH